jgi:undecaprenyl pyrophosphate phosphatase UppP
MMNWLEALILGIVQGLTEFLPVSSSGHLELGKAIFNLSTENDMTFAVVVHGATVLSTIVVFFNELRSLLVNTFSFKWNSSTKYVLKLLLSMIPVSIYNRIICLQLDDKTCEKRKANLFRPVLPCDWDNSYYIGNLIYD